MYISKKHCYYSTALTRYVHGSGVVIDAYIILKNYELNYKPFIYVYNTAIRQLMQYIKYLNVAELPL